MPWPSSRSQPLPKVFELLRLPALLRHPEWPCTTYSVKYAPTWCHSSGKRPCCGRVCVCGTSVQMKNFLFIQTSTNVDVCRGTIHVLCAMVQRSGHSTCGYHGWSPWRTCLLMFYSENGEGLSREPQKWVLNFTRLSQSEFIFRRYFLLGSCGILRDGEGLSREPWRGYLFGGLDSSLVYVQRFRKTIYLFAIFIEEIYFRSMLLVWFAL